MDKETEIYLKDKQVSHNLLGTLSAEELAYLYWRAKESPHSYKADLSREWMRSYECSRESLAIRNKIGPSQLQKITFKMIDYERFYEFVGKIPPKPW